MFNEIINEESISRCRKSCGIKVTQWIDSYTEGANKGRSRCDKRVHVRTVKNIMACEVQGVKNLKPVGVNLVLYARQKT